MEKSNVKRVRNILSGNYKGKTLTSIGYSKKEEEYVEGDVWEEGGKTWTIKNGIRQTVTKLNKVRELTRMPLTCPECKGVMRKRLDKKMWNLRGKCFDCVIDEDTEKIKEGTFKEYQHGIIANNMKTYLDQVKDFFEDYIDKSDSKHYVSEQGDVEDWQGGFNKEELKTMFDAQIDEFKKHIKEYNNSEKDNEKI